jgi:hypothetical protein
MSSSNEHNIRGCMLAELLHFVYSASQLSGMHSISLLGSITTSRVNPKDVDVLVAVADNVDLEPIAACVRRLKGRLQSLNHGADVFLADEHGCYLGRVCRWRECGPGIRASCPADHCGRRPYLCDDLSALRLDPTLVASPPVQLWPRVERRCSLPDDVEDFLARLQHSA